MLADSCELECAGIDEGIMDILHSAVIFWSVRYEVDDLLFIEELLEVGKYGSDFEAANFCDFLQRKSLFEIDKSLVVWWNLFS